MTIIQEPPGSIDEMNRFDTLADQLHKVGVFVYFVVLLIVPLLMVNLPPVHRVLLSLVRELGSIWTKEGMVADDAVAVAAVLVIIAASGLLSIMVRSLFGEIGSKISAKHPVNLALASSQLGDQAKSLVLFAAQTKHARGWVRMRASGQSLLLAPGNWLRGALVVLIVVSFALGPDNPSSAVDVLSKPAINTTPAGREVPAATDLYEGDPEEGAKRLRQAGAAGSADANHLLARLYFAGMAVARDDDEGLRLGELAAQQGSGRAMSWLGNRLIWGIAVPQDQPRGLAYLKKAFELGGAKPDGRTLHRMGQAYWYGGGVQKDVPTAVTYFRRAVAAGFAASAYFLGEDAKTSDRMSEAVEHWRTAATQAGDGYAQFALFQAYYDGRGVTQGDRPARDWLLRSARQGNSSAQVWLGYHYEVGRIVRKDPIESLRWSLRAAAKGNADGMYRAAVAFEQQADRSHTRPAHSLSYMFFNLAAAKGDSRAPQRRDAMASRLSRAELDEAQADATRFEANARDLSKLVLAGTGTGFFVDVGTVVTNEHVIGECATVVVETPSDLLSDVTVIGANADLDLAILDVRAPQGRAILRRIATFAPAEPSLGERATAFGFPLTGTLASSGSLTDGTVTALAGLHDDETRLQFSTPVQPGNSGGALLDERGHLIGVVQAVLNPITQGQNTFIPQNVNFGIKSRQTQAMLMAMGRLPRTGSATAAVIDLKARGALAQSMSVRIRCYASPVERTLNSMRPQ